MKTVLIVVNGLIASLLLCSCSTPTHPQSAQHFAPLRFSAQTQHLLPSPAMLKEEYAHPAKSTSQTFSWGSHGTDWILRENSTPMEYAGFYIRRPLDLGSFAYSQSLQFSIRPVTAVDNLTLALISGNGQILLLPGKNLATYPSKIWLQGWLNVTIDVSDFQPSHGAGPIDFDWSDIRQVRILKVNPRIELGEVEIRNLRFRPDTFAMLR